MFRWLHNQSKKVSQGRTPRNRSTGFETLENRQLLSGNPLGALASPNIDSPAYTTAACYPTTGPLLHLATSTTQASTKTALASPNIDSPAYTTAACYPTTGPLLHLATSTTQASTKTALASPNIDSPAYTTAACYPTTGPLLHLDGVKENEGVGPLPSLHDPGIGHDRPGFLLAPG